MKRLSPKLLAALGFLVYFASYMTRKSYNGIIDGITSEFYNVPASFALITYGIGQLISGYIGDKIKPQWIIFIGLVSSSVINLMMTLDRGIVFMCILWALNGFAQSLIWPPLVRIMASNMTPTEYNKACVTVNAAGSIATVAIYILSYVFLMFSWKYMFILSTAIGIIAAVIFIIIATKRLSVSDVPTKVSDKDDPSSSGSKIKFSTVILTSGLLFICMSILFQGTLRDGIETVMPVFLKEFYNISDENSITTFLSVSIPIFSVVALKVTSIINEKLIKNELILSIILFAISVTCTTLASLKMHIIVCVFLMALATGCMHGINLMLVCQIPRRFVKYGKSSLISGAMNFFTYVGGAIFTFGIALIDNWMIVLIICSTVAALGIIMCFIANKNWKVFSEKNK